jgi:quercetin dioxygenase-like cupin family protein
MTEFLPGDDCSAFQPERYPGVEMVYVLSGALELERKGEPHRLQARDVCYISGETQRTYRCAGEEPARALIISFDRESEPRRSSAA